MKNDGVDDLDSELRILRIGSNVKGLLLCHWNDYAISSYNFANIRVSQFQLKQKWVMLILLLLRVVGAQGEHPISGIIQNKQDFPVSQAWACYKYTCSALVRVRCFEWSDNPGRQYLGKDCWL